MSDERNVIGNSGDSLKGIVCCSEKECPVVVVIVLWFFPSTNVFGGLEFFEGSNEYIKGKTNGFTLLFVVGSFLGLSAEFFHAENHGFEWDRNFSVEVVHDRKAFFAHVGILLDRYAITCNTSEVPKVTPAGRTSKARIQGTSRFLRLKTIEGRLQI